MRASSEAAGWLRPAAALAGAVLVGACTTSSNPAVTGSHPATQPPVVAAADGCNLPVLREPGPDRDDGKLVLGIISIGDAPWRTVRVHQGRWRYWQKDGHDIRAGHQTVTITVPPSLAESRGHHLGGERRDRQYAAAARLPGHARLNQWLRGRFYLRSRSACVPLVFSVGRHSALVRVGVGRRCGPGP